MADITFPRVAGDPVTVDNADIASVKASGGLAIVTMLDGTVYRSPAPAELVLTAAQTGVQPVESRPPVQPEARALSSWLG